MPTRKLSQEAVDELHDAYDELGRTSPKRIVRSDGAGNLDFPGWTGPRTITQVGELAAWKGISESYFHALKREGWQLKRGVPRVVEEMVPASVWNATLQATFDLFASRLEAKDRRIAELEAEVAELRRNR